MFYGRAQGEEESVIEFESELRKLAYAVHSTISSVKHSETALCVCGLKNQSIQKRLLAEPDLSLQKALEIAVNMEAAER